MARTILVVDDESVVRETIKKILEEEGFFVLSAEDGKSALEIHRVHAIDIALLDLKLPDITGAEVLERMKLVNPAIEAVIMTAFEMEDLVNRAFACGAYACLHKPFAIKALLEVFEQLERRNG